MYRIKQRWLTPPSLKKRQDLLNMKKFILINLALLACLFSGIVRADVTSSWEKLTEIRMGWDSEKVIILMNNFPQPSPACAVTTFGVVPNTQSNRNQILSIALAALAADRDVKIVVKNNTCDGGLYPQIRSIHIK